MLIDAHTHIRREDVENGILRVMDTADIYALAVATNPEEAVWVDELATLSPRIMPIYGLHPWYADRYLLSEMTAYLEKTPILGEIGMDSTWCSVDLDCQRRIFIEQLELAEERGCPVMLHTKGQEKEIAHMIHTYTMPVIVHWYSSMDYLDQYLERDCFFTIGPDVRINPAVQQVVTKAPLDRLLVETDGLAAIEWALGRKALSEDWPALLLDGVDYVAEIKAVSRDRVLKEMHLSSKIG